MAIDRPMDPTRDSSNIVQFRSASQAARISQQSEEAPIIPLPRRSPKTFPAGFVSSDISLNERLRNERHAGWRAARAKAEIWRARMEMHDKIMIAQKYRLPEVRGVPPHDNGDRLPLVAAWRAAQMAQILTPAPDAKSVIWKRRVVEGLNPWDWIGVKPERVERAIADDEAFLKAYPTRHCRHRPNQSLPAD